MAQGLQVPGVIRAAFSLAHDVVHISGRPSADLTERVILEEPCPQSAPFCPVPLRRGASPLLVVLMIKLPLVRWAEPFPCGDQVRASWEGAWVRRLGRHGPLPSRDS